MVNRTISLDNVTDAMRQQLVNNGENFSQWVRNQLRSMDINQVQKKPEARPKPNKHYLCRHCKQAGHWSDQCPYIEVIE
jgi:hypothetical protein